MHNPASNNRQCEKDAGVGLHIFAFTFISYNCSGKRCRDRAFVYLPSLLCHPYLVCLLFGMPSMPFYVSNF